MINGPGKSSLGNLFYGTGIPACITVLDMEHSGLAKNLPMEERGIFMIDASKGFAKDGNKNRPREQDIHKIVDVFTHYFFIQYNQKAI